MEAEEKQQEPQGVSTENYKLLLETIAKQNQTISNLEQKIVDVVSLNEALLSNKQTTPKTQSQEEIETKKPTFKDLLKKL